MTQDFKTKLQELIDETAANRYKIHQSMTAHLEFNQGAAFLMPMIESLIEHREWLIKRHISNPYLTVCCKELNNELLNLLKGEKNG